MAAAIEAIPEGFILLDPNDRVVLCNTQYRDVYGLNPGLAAPGVKFETIVRFMAENGLYALDGHSIEAWIASRMDQHRNCDGSRFYQTLSDGRCVQVQERRASDGDIVGIRVDVTDARQREAAEHDRQKLAALGQLAGGVAHEINNLLQPILTLPDLVLERVPADDTEASEDLACVTEAARKISRYRPQYPVVRAQGGAATDRIGHGRRAPRGGRFCARSHPTVGGSARG